MESDQSLTAFFDLYPSYYGGRRSLLTLYNRWQRAKRYRVHEVGPQAQLRLVGEGELMEAAQGQVPEVVLEHHIPFVGLRSSMHRLMKAADISVMPSMREGMPVTMLEPSIAGLRIVITDRPGMREANEICCEGHLLATGASAQAWWDAVLEVLGGPPHDAAESLHRIRTSPVACESVVLAMAQIYDERLA